MNTETPTDSVSVNDKPQLARALSAVEARVLGTLIEKSLTTPDQYPLTLNSTRVGCNQKTSRDPISDYDERAVGMALKDLLDLKLVKEVFPPDRGAVKYEQRLGAVLDLRLPAIASLGILLLRGPQTPGELRQNAYRLHAFADVESLIDVLERLATRVPALVQNLGRSPGQREDRYAQLLCGRAAIESKVSVIASAQPASHATPASTASAAQTQAQIQALQDAVLALTRRVEELERALDLPQRN